MSLVDYLSPFKFVVEESERTPQHLLSMNKVLGSIPNTENKIEKNGKLYFKKTEKKHSSDNS